MDHATQIQLTEFFAKFMVADLQLDVCRISRNRLVANNHDNLAAQDTVIAGRNPMEAPARRGFHKELLSGDGKDRSTALR